MLALHRLRRESLARRAATALEAPRVLGLLMRVPRVALGQR